MRANAIRMKADYIAMGMSTLRLKMKRNRNLNYTGIVSDFRREGVSISGFSNSQKNKYRAGNEVSPF